MNVVLILNREGVKGLRVIVKLQTSALRKKVTALMEENKVRQAFDLMLKEAEVAEYLPEGREPKIKPSLVLREDIL